MNNFAGRIAVGLTLLSVGFTVGWWSHKVYSPKQTLSPPRGVERSVAPLITAVAESDEPDVEEHTDDNDDQQPERALLSEFIRLLDQGAFDEAMLVYDEAEAGNEALAQRFRQLLRERLQHFLEQLQVQPLMALIDLYLSRHYDDTAVLMILAEYQRQQGYPEEAARVFQMAFAYAYQPSERENISNAFRSMVEKTDQQFKQQQRWIELLGFYQLLDSISLIEPRHRLRQAQLYHTTGDSRSARSILTSMLADPRWGQQAQKMLAALEQQQLPEPEVANATAIPLQRSGNHYLVTVQVNQQDDLVLMIDTGASITSLSEQSFARLSDSRRFDRLGSRLFNTANGVTKGSVYRARELALGRYQVQGVQLAVLDFQPREGVDGLLGMNVLQHFRFEIDQDQQQLLLRPR